VERYAQSIVWRPLIVAEEPSAWPTRHFAAASSGIATNVTADSPIPTQLVAGC
jgi:hypothetical protein